MVPEFFFALKTGMGLSCTICKITRTYIFRFFWRGRVILLAIQTNGTENFGRSGKSGGKVKARS